MGCHHQFNQRCSGKPLCLSQLGLLRSLLSVLTGCPESGPFFILPNTAFICSLSATSFLMVLLLMSLFLLSATFILFHVVSLLNLLFPLHQQPQQLYSQLLLLALYTDSTKHTTTMYANIRTKVRQQSPRSWNSPGTCQ